LQVTLEKARLLPINGELTRTTSRRHEPARACKARRAHHRLRFPGAVKTSVKINGVKARLIDASDQWCMAHDR
jgi:hypothetical protein